MVYFERSNQMFRISHLGITGPGSGQIRGDYDYRSFYWNAVSSL